MNKRILKLFNEAGFHQPEMERLGIEDKFEKFAELIVRECASICEKDKKGFPNSDSVKQGLADMIKQHFGVEE